MPWPVIWLVREFAAGFPMRVKTRSSNIFANGWRPLADEG